MRRIALGLLAAAAFGAPALAAEPDGPATLITPTEAVRITVQGLLSGKSGNAHQDERDALIEYYSVPDQRLLWVDDGGLTERAKMVMAEIGKADDYGLRALPIMRCRMPPVSIPRSPRPGTGSPMPR